MITLHSKGGGSGVAQYRPVKQARAVVALELPNDTRTDVHATTNATDGLPKRALVLEVLYQAWLLDWRAKGKPYPTGEEIAQVSLEGLARDRATMDACGLKGAWHPVTGLRTWDELADNARGKMRALEETTQEP